MLLLFFLVSDLFILISFTQSLSLGLLLWIESSGLTERFDEIELKNYSQGETYL